MKFLQQLWALLVAFLAISPLWLIVIGGLLLPWVLPAALLVAFLLFPYAVWRRWREAP